MTRAAVLVFVLLALLSLACQQQQRFPEMAFAVADSLLGPAQRDLSIGVRYRAPKGWQARAVPPAVVPKWVASLGEGGDSLTCWIDSAGQRGLLLSPLTNVPDSLLQGLIDHPERVFVQTQAVTTTYRHGPMVIVQQSLRDSSWTGFHIMGMEGTSRRFRLLLYCPRHSYERTARTWESVIGSLEPVGGKATP